MGAITDGIDDDPVPKMNNKDPKRNNKNQPDSSYLSTFYISGKKMMAFTF